MNSFLPYESYTQSAKVLDNLRLNSCINEALVILRSHSKVYDIKPRTGLSGWEAHTVALFWKGHEYQLAQYGLALAKEWFDRPIPKIAERLEAFNQRKLRLQQWRALNEFMEDLGWEDSKPLLLGDKDFHSGMRAFLLFKECMALTYKNWKANVYPDHAVTRSLLPRKSSWKRNHYLQIWDVFGRPDPVWYAQWGWEEEPDDTLLFYSLDKQSQIMKEMQRKKDRPMVSYLQRYGTYIQPISSTD